MATITSTGIGSGLDVNSIVTQLMAIEKQPLTVLDKKEAGFQAQLTAFGTLKGALSSFQNAMSELSSVGKFQALTATSSDPSVFTVASSSTAVAGNYSVEVKQLAQAQKLVSGTFANTTDVVGTGTLTFQFGTYGVGGFVVNSDKSVQNITITDANKTLSGVRDAINAAKIGVTATILNDGTGNRLVITSQDTGAANSLRITVDDASDGNGLDNAGLSRLAYNPALTLDAGKNLESKVDAQNALLKVDGVDNISKASNTISDVVQGVTLTLLKQSAANTPAILSVTTDTNTVQAALRNFVNSYNDLDGTVKDLTAYDPTTRVAGTLQGDSAARSVLSQVRRTLNESLSGIGGQYNLLSQVGITFQKDGSLALDSDKLQQAIDGGYNDIPALFANVGSPSDSLVRFVSATDKSVAGRYSLSITQLATRGAFTGVATAALADTGGTFGAPLVIDGTNNTLALTVDGVRSATVTLTQGSYTTAAQLTAEIQSKINGDAAFKAAGVHVTAAFDSATDKLSITSDRYGSASSVAINSVGSGSAASLGLSVATGSSGVDVAGTINGIVATGSGRFLTGAGGGVDGLKLEVTGGATGNRGTLDYSLGYAYRLNQLANRLLGSGGPIASRNSGINESIDDINARREVLNRRIAAAEVRYRAQFSALDTLMGQLRSTSDFLTRQLAILPSAKG